MKDFILNALLLIFAAALIIGVNYILASTGRPESVWLMEALGIEL